MKLIWTKSKWEMWDDPLPRFLARAKADGADVLTITPEFGPPPYMPVEPHTQRPLADAWTINVAFREWLARHL